METIINFSNVSKIYILGSERVTALNNINLSISKGEFCCVLGASGSGKSTLLNIIAGLEKPSRGSIKIKNTCVEKLDEAKLAYFRQKYIGFIFQSYNLINHLDAVENVALPLAFRGMPKKDRIKKAIEILKNVGLSSHLKHTPSQMSGGQQQRVGIARALVTNPEIILADEPTGNLDSNTTKDILELITAVIRKNGQTLVMVTHDSSIAKRADKIIYLKDGKIERIEKQ